MTGLRAARCPHCGSAMFHDGSVAGRTVACPACRRPFAIAPDPGTPDEFERVWRDDALGLTCRLWGYAPVQGEGFVGGASFYFRAKWDTWSFTACLNPRHESGDEASSINPPEWVHGFFEDEPFEDGYVFRGFYLDGAYDGASRMPYDEASEIVRACARRLREALGGG